MLASLTDTLLIGASCAVILELLHIYMLRQVSKIWENPFDE